MKKQEIIPGLRITFLLHAVIGSLVGFQHLLAPRLWTDLAGLQIAETVTWRLIGAALIGFALGSWLAYRETDWDRVQIVVIMQIAWSVLGALVIAWGIVLESLPPLEWLNATLLVVFALAFAFWGTRMVAAQG